jgi:hypothetical protein
MTDQRAWANSLTVEQVRELMPTNNGYPLSLLASSIVIRTLLRELLWIEPAEPPPRPTPLYPGSGDLEARMAEHDAWARALTPGQIRAVVNGDDDYPFSLLAANDVVRTLLREIPPPRPPWWSYLAWW